MRRKDLAHPVRVLLLERVSDATLDQVLFGTDGSKGEMYAKLHDEEWLELTTLSEDALWIMSQPFLAHETSSINIDRATFFTRLDNIDADRRPLSALLLAEAITTDPNGHALSSLGALLKTLIERERDHWPKESPDSQLCAIRPQVEDAFLALATMINGYQPEIHYDVLPLEAQALAEQCRVEPCWTASARLQGTGTSGIGRIEPDLIGEFFALDVIDRRRGASLRRLFEWLPEAAWRLGNNNMVEFTVRAHQNFPNHPGLSVIETPLPGVEGSFSAIALNIFHDALIKEQNPVTAIDAVHEYLSVSLDNDPMARAVLSDFLILLTKTLKCFDTRVRILLDEVGQVMMDHPDELHCVIDGP
jgi:hypothetical protein